MVSKEARVTEEVTVGKDVHVKEETVRDTVRKQEVEVEREGTTRPQSAPSLNMVFESLSWNRAQPLTGWARLL